MFEARAVRERLLRAAGADDSIQILWRTPKTLHAGVDTDCRMRRAQQHGVIDGAYRWGDPVARVFVRVHRDRWTERKDSLPSDSMQIDFGRFLKLENAKP